MNEREFYYEIIDAYLADSEKKFYKQSELVRIFRDFGIELNLTKLTSLFNEMRFNREVGLHAPIGRDFSRGYWYTEEGYTIKAKKESIRIYRQIAERLQLIEAQTSNEQVDEWTRFFIRFVTNSVNERDQHNLEQENNDRQRTPFPTEVALGKILSAMLDKKRMHISYTLLWGKELLSYTVHPYCITGDYLVGYVEETHSLMSFEIRSIKEVVITDGIYKDDHLDVARNYIKEVKRAVKKWKDHESLKISFPPIAKSAMNKLKSAIRYGRIEVLEDNEQVFTIEVKWNADLKEQVILHHGYNIRKVEKTEGKKEVKKLEKKKMDKPKPEQIEPEKLTELELIELIKLMERVNYNLNLSEVAVVSNRGTIAREKANAIPLFDFR